METEKLKRSQINYLLNEALEAVNDLIKNEPLAENKTVRNKIKEAIFWLNADKEILNP